MKKRPCHKNVLLILTNEKHFSKTISQLEFAYEFFKDLPNIIVDCDFSPSSFKLKRVILPLLTKYVPELKIGIRITCHIKLIFLL